MDNKTDTEVVIGGKVFTLSGYESEEYLQRLAAYINGKIAEYRQVENFAKQSNDIQSVLMELNIADDFFKAKRQVDLLQEDIDRKDKELYDVKHDLITKEIKLTSMEETLKELQNANNENELRIVELETTLREKGQGTLRLNGSSSEEEAEEVEETDDPEVESAQAVYARRDKRKRRR